MLVARQIESCCLVGSEMTHDLKVVSSNPVTSIQDGGGVKATQEFQPESPGTICQTFTEGRQVYM